MKLAYVYIPYANKLDFAEGIFEATVTGNSSNSPVQMHSVSDSET